MSATRSSPDPFGQVRSEIAQRSLELVNFWSDIRTWELPPPARQPFRFRAGKGLVLVYIYGLLEFSTTKLVGQLSQLVSDASVRGKDLSPSIRVLAHEARIKSIISVSEKKCIKQRLALYEEIAQRGVCTISDGILSTQLQNIWAVSIENIFASFGITDAPFFDGNFGTRADRLVDDRNAIAHGRETPEVVGEKYASEEVDQLIRETGQQISYMETCMSSYYSSKLYVASEWRHRYA